MCVWKLCCNNLSNSDVVPLRRQWMNYVTFAVLCWTITILVCRKVGLKSFVISVDYRDYMSSSLETWLLVRSFLYLNSYNLVGSTTKHLCKFYHTSNITWGASHRNFTSFRVLQQRIPKSTHLLFYDFSSIYYDFLKVSQFPTKLSQTGPHSTIHLSHVLCKKPPGFSRISIRGP